MARNGHPRVPRKIRGERRAALRAYGTVPLPTVRRVQKIANRLPVQQQAVRDAYEPLVRAALGNEADWDGFMAAQQVADEARFRLLRVGPKSGPRGT